MGNLALLFDTETTGLFRYDRRADQAGQPRLCSIAAELIDIDTREVVDSMHRLCDGSDFTREDWMKAEEPHGAFEYNHLSASLMMAEGVPVETILHEFATLEDRISEACGYVAYVADFDLKVMRGERRRHHRDDRYNFRPRFDPKEEMKHLLGLTRGAKPSENVRGTVRREDPAHRQ